MALTCMFGGKQSWRSYARLTGRHTGRMDDLKEGESKGRGASKEQRDAWTRGNVHMQGQDAYLSSLERTMDIDSIISLDDLGRRPSACVCVAFGPSTARPVAHVHTQAARPQRVCLERSCMFTAAEASLPRLKIRFASSGGCHVVCKMCGHSPGMDQQVETFMVIPHAMIKIVASYVLKS
eukprot:359219-Chlamydomonas_euryale.AAC.19